MIIQNIISLLGGLALFLYGMRIMGDGLAKGSTGSFKKALEKVTNNPVLSFLIGLLLTAVIQSATATIVIVSGLVSAGILTLSQSIGIILGANVGTTVTGQIIRLLDINAEDSSWLNFFKPNTLAPLAAVIGIVFIMAVKSQNSKTVGSIAMGFGILFTGLINMTASVEPLTQSEAFTGIFMAFSNNAFLGFLCGFAVAFILQSSSATIGILQALSISGLLSFKSIYPMIIGIYLGDCVTTGIVCSIGTKADAKRTGFVNILFNLSEIVLITVAVNVLHALGVLDAIWSKPITSGGIANTHTIFNLSCAIVMLPVCKTYGKLANKIIKDDKKPTDVELDILDEALFSSPALALNNCYQSMSTMVDMLSEDSAAAVSLLGKFDPDVLQKISDDENYIDKMTDNIGAYLAKLSPHLNPGLQESIQNYYLQCINDFERASDHIYSLAMCVKELNESGMSYSDIALDEIAIIKDAMQKMMECVENAFKKQNQDDAKQIQPFVDVINELCIACKDKHIDRMRHGKCDALLGSSFVDVLTHMGRIADMCSNVGIHTLSRHNEGTVNYEHEYIIHLHSGEDEEFNEKVKGLRAEYFLKIGAENLTA